MIASALPPTAKTVPRFETRLATILIESGKDVSVVSRVLGHADVSTTANVYAHLTPAMLDRTASRIDGVLGASPEREKGTARRTQTG